MKKYVLSISFIAALIIGCMFGITAYAEDPIDISTATITTAETSYTYTGSAIKPEVKVKVAGVDELGNPIKVSLVKNTDFKVSYSNNINVGEGTAKVTGIGKYTGSQSVTFKITPYSMNGAKIKAVVKGRTYINKTPNVVVTFNGETLVKNTDYTISVSNNDKVGYKAGSIKITGKGRFSGTKKGNFNIYPKAVKNVKASAIKQNSLKLTWTASTEKGVKGYKIYKGDVNGDNAKLLKTVSSNSATLSNVDSATRYNFFVVAYSSTDGNTVKSSMSSVCVTCTKPKKVELNYCAKKKGSKIYADWNSVYNASGYEIRFSIDKTYKNKDYLRTAKAGASATSKTMSVQNTSVAHFIQVRAYKKYKYNGKTKTVYGPWSNKMSTVFGRVYKEYTTTHVKNANRTTNLKLACKAIDGTVLMPGETFSFNKVVGQRTAAKGYKPAPIFTGATTHANGVGGGICQVASTMFNAALLANFKIVERYQHSQKVTYTPAGRDAAIYWGSENFRFKNNTNYPIKIKMTCANGKVTCQYLVSYNIKAPKVKLSVTKSGKTYTLKRTVNGKVNYTTRSTY